MIVVYFSIDWGTKNGLKPLLSIRMDLGCVLVV
jgi:hypothetical protein